MIPYYPRPRAVIERLAYAAVATALLAACGGNSANIGGTPSVPSSPNSNAAAPTRRLCTNSGPGLRALNLRTFEVAAVLPSGMMLEAIRLATPEEVMKLKLRAPYIATLGAIVTVPDRPDLPPELLVAVGESSEHAAAEGKQEADNYLTKPGPRGTCNQTFIDGDNGERYEFRP